MARNSPELLTETSRMIGEQIATHAETVEQTKGSITQQACAMWSVARGVSGRSYRAIASSSAILRVTPTTIANRRLEFFLRRNLRYRKRSVAPVLGERPRIGIQSAWQACRLRYTTIRFAQRCERRRVPAPNESVERITRDRAVRYAIATLGRYAPRPRACPAFRIAACRLSQGS